MLGDTANALEDDAGQDPRSGVPDKKLNEEIAEITKAQPVQITKEMEEDLKNIEQAFEFLEEQPDTKEYLSNSTSCYMDKPPIRNLINNFDERGRRDGGKVIYL